jgi:hypothetical protein
VDDGVDARDGRGNGPIVGEGRDEELAFDAVEVATGARRQVVDDADAVTRGRQASGEVGPDEPRAAGDEDGPVQREDAPDVRAGSVAAGSQRTFWTSVVLSIASRCCEIRRSIESISSSLSSRGWRPRSSSLEWRGW